MNVCILMGSPRAAGNTAALLHPLTEELTAQGAAVDTHWLCRKQIKPCTACRACQGDWSRFGCPQEDDMQVLFDAVLRAQLLILATPIYSWYCTPPMKAALDRLVYGMNKYYGAEKGPSIWRGKRVALVTTCGYRPEQGADLWEEGMKRYCKHSNLVYLGMLAERDLGYQAVFMSQDKERHAREFAHAIYRAAQ